ncbi:MAG: TIGR02186 family protein [Acetobacteraceae bacterium]|nr:TIGR02186 family protein [Acetobacteraceae bacterium]MCX7685374.1 TIGR02186 family protein [Acetobacteraceae bacterium]MDW8397714.1 TIGR02186 family protein [Acetobacteraceae bacterium]
MIRAALLVLVLLLPAGSRAEEALISRLSDRRVEITTAFTGAAILVFGTTGAPLGPASGHDVLIRVEGPPQPMVVRRRVRVAGLWVPGPTATFPEVPSFYALAGTRPHWEVLSEGERAAARLGLINLPMRAVGEQAPVFRAALLTLKQEAGLWVEQPEPVSVDGGRLFSARIPLPSTVAPGEYRVSVLLVAEGRVLEWQEHGLSVLRVGTAATIAGLARNWPLLYGLVSVLLAAAAGWLGSILFRRG